MLSVVNGLFGKIYGDDTVLKLGLVSQFSRIELELGSIRNCNTTESGVGALDTNNCQSFFSLKVSFLTLSNENTLELIIDKL